MSARRISFQRPRNPSDRRCVSLMKSSRKPIAPQPSVTKSTLRAGTLELSVCANVANLVLARLSARRTEIAVRAALGAGRWPLARQVIAESLVLAAAGCALGLFVAWAGVRFVRALPEGSLPRMSDVRLDGGVLLFAIGIS